MSILFLGTSSGCGKTTVCAMMCRYLHNQGYDVVPFKASNLTLRTVITSDRREIGTAQAFQAMACGLEPDADMNPVLFKPCGDGRMHLVVNGRPFMELTRDSHADHGMLVESVRAAYMRLSAEHDVVLCEGSGSPAEINLFATDIANTGLMRSIGVPAVLVCDIDRGGAFAAIYGTWKLIPDDLKPQMKGFIINRFRGDRSLLGESLRSMEDLTGMKCLGVLRYEHLEFPAEDSLSSSEASLTGGDSDTVFLSNLDTMIDHAEQDGFDFDSIKRIIGMKP